MKIIKTNGKNNSQWSDKLTESSVKKYSSLSVDLGSVFCPLSNSVVKTLNCEICQHCKGVDFHVASSTESIKCAHKESANVKQIKIDEVDRLFISESSKKPTMNTELPEDLKSIFARSTAKFDDLGDEDIMGSHKIVSTKNINESDSDGTANFIPKYSNSIFNADTIAQLQEAGIKEEEEKVQKAKTAVAEKAELEREWETDIKAELEEIEYEPKGSVMSIAHEAKANNPDVSEYKFSIFESIDDKLKNIAELTEGEKLKSQASERKANISRDKEEDDWESNPKGVTSTSGIVKDFFAKTFGE